MSATPSFSAEEIRRREQTLLRCFECCDTNGDGVIDAKELEAVARAFTSANTSAQTAAAPASQQHAAAGAATAAANGDAQQAASAGMNVDQEVRVIMGKLDRNLDGVISSEEWIHVLNELFKFMNSTAFEKHAAELLTTATHLHSATSSKQSEGHQSSTQGTAAVV